MNKETVGIAVVVLIIVIIILLLLRGKNSKSTNLEYLEYQYDEYSDVYSSLYVDLKKYKIKVYYRNNKYKVVKVNKSIIKEIDKLFFKYDVLNWDNYKKIEYLDGDNTTIYYAVKNKERKHISMESHPEGFDNFFIEMKNILEKKIK